MAIKVNNCGISKASGRDISCSTFVKPNISTIKYNVETGEVFDEFDNYLGKGILKEGFIEVQMGSV